MPSSFTVPTLDEMTDLLVAAYQNLFPRHNVARYSDNWKRLRTLAIAATSLHAHVDTVYDDLMPDRAEGEFLERIGAIYNVIKKEATAAQKSDALRVYGTAGSSVAIGDELVHSSGLTFQVNENASIGVGDTYVDVDVLSIDTGSATRLSAGEVLTFLSAPSGIESEAELQVDIDEDGDDEETDGAYRTRILDKIAQPGMGGNSNDYRTWAMEVTGVVSAYVYPLRAGNGTVDLVALHSGRGADRVLTTTEVDEVQDYIDERRPVSVFDFRVLTVEPTYEHVEVTIEPEDDYEFDWDDSAGYTVSAVSGNSLVTLNTSRPPSLIVGSRVIFKSNTANKGKGIECVVESLGPLATQFTVENLDEDYLTDAEATIELSSNVYSGGPLVEPVREAILEHFDALGPPRGDYASGTWEGTLRTSTLFKLVQTTTGVLDSNLIEPTTNQESTESPPAAAIGLIIPGRVLVRRA